MESNDYDKILNLALECEGLAILLRERDESAPEEAYALLREKIGEMAALVGLANESAEAVAETAAEVAQSVEFEEQEDAAGATEEEAEKPTTAEEPKAEEAAEAPEPVDAEASKTPEKAPEYEVVDRFVEPEPMAEDEMSETPAGAIDDTSHFEAPQYETAPRYEEMSEYDNGPSYEPEESGRQLTLGESLGYGQNLHTAFNFNDMIRFRRELFANSQTQFNDTLDVITAMSSADEAEEYLYEDLCWDPGNEDVADFVAIIRRYFGQP